MAPLFLAFLASVTIPVSDWAAPRTFFICLPHEKGDGGWTLQFAKKGDDDYIVVDGHAPRFASDRPLKFGIEHPFQKIDYQRDDSGQQWDLDVAGAYEGSAIKMHLVLTRATGEGAQASFVIEKSGQTYSVGRCFVAPTPPLPIEKWWKK